MARNQTTRKRYRRGGKAHYASLARRSVDSRIKRHIECETVLDTSRVTKLPVRKRETDAGYDLASPEAFKIQPGQQHTVLLGVHVKCPPGYFYEVRGRSSLIAQGLETRANIIDATYTGELRVTLINHSNLPHKFNVGDRIAQLIFLPQIHVKFKVVPAFERSADERGDAGFGSSGLASSAT